MPIECSQHGATAVPRSSCAPVDAAGCALAEGIATGNALGATVLTSGCSAGAATGAPGGDSRQARSTCALTQAADAPPRPLDTPFHRDQHGVARRFSAHGLPQHRPRLHRMAVRDDLPASTSTDRSHCRGKRP